MLVVEKLGGAKMNSRREVPLDVCDYRDHSSGAVGISGSVREQQ